MGLNSEDPISIEHLVESKSTANQTAYKHISRPFSTLSSKAYLLVAPAFSKGKSITLNQKKNHTLELGGAEKIGFRMSYQNKTEG